MWAFTRDPHWLVFSFLSQVDCSGCEDKDTGFLSGAKLTGIVGALGDSQGLCRRVLVGSQRQDAEVSSKWSLQGRCFGLSLGRGRDSCKSPLETSHLHSVPGQSWSLLRT